MDRLDRSRQAARNILLISHILYLMCQPCMSVQHCPSTKQSAWICVTGTVHPALMSGWVSALELCAHMQLPDCCLQLPGSYAHSLLSVSLSLARTHEMAHTSTRAQQAHAHARAHTAAHNQNSGEAAAHSASYLSSRLSRWEAADANSMLSPSLLGWRALGLRNRPALRLLYSIAPLYTAPSPHSV